jgi:GNAT superfamily N-acetyltransferase
MPADAATRFEIAPWRQSEHLAASVELSRAVGWPHRRDDWQFAAELGEGYAALDAGRLVGTAFRWRYGGGQVRVGSVIVDPVLQRAGLGRRLMEACLAGLEDRTVLLNATEAGLPLYRRLGFTEVGRFEQWQGVVDGTAAPAAAVGVGLRSAVPGDHAALAGLDREAIGADRAVVLAALYGAGETLVAEEDGRPTGFVVCRASGRGDLVGPLVARDGATAKALLLACAAARRGAFLRVDTPADGGLGPTLQALGLAEVDTVVCMSKGRHLPGTGVRTFALASQALG